MAGGNVPAQIAPIFQQTASQSGVPASVLAGIASVESNLGANQGPSSAGAVGPMQFLPSTAKGLGINPLDWKQAIFGAAKLLNQYGYQQNPSRAIGAYNGGPGNPQYSYAAQVIAEAKRLAPQLSGSTAGGLPSIGGGSSQTGSQSVSVPVTSQVFDQQAFKQALGKFIAGTAVRQSGGSGNPYAASPGATKGFAASLGGSNPLFAKGLLTTSAPNAQNYVSTQTHNEQIATGQLQALAGQPLVNIHGGAAGDVNPTPGAVIGRTDQGVDENLQPGAPIVAPNAAKVVAIVPNWYKGQPYIAIQLTAGPNAGKVMYVAEQIAPGVKVGQTLGRGAVIGRYANSGTGIEIGWASPQDPTRTLAQATTGYTEGQQTRAGTNFRSFLGNLG